MAAEASSKFAAAEQTGIPESTVRYWMDSPKFAVYREKAREAMAEEAAVAARLAWHKLIEAIEAGLLEPRDLVMAAGMATDKAQLLGGGPTARTETRAITDDLSDHESAILRELLHSAIEEAATVPAEGDPG